MNYDYYILRPAVNPASDGVWVVELWCVNAIDQQERFDIALFDGRNARHLAESYAASFGIPAR